MSEFYKKSDINKLNLYIRHIYKQLLEGEKYINQLDIISSVERDININTKSISDIKDNTYLPHSIKEYILTNTRESTIYKTTINGKNIRLTFSHMNNAKALIKKSDVHLAFLIIYLLSLYTCSKCSRELIINIFDYSR